jgi:predicted XRE-type DNA-binding protein/phage-related protein
MTKQVRKPVKWVSSAKRDLDAMPEDVKYVFGHAIDLAQAGGKHRDAKVLTGFGSAGVLEVVEDTQGDTYRAVNTARSTQMNESQEITVQVGSTNVYADLGYADAAEMQRKSRLASEIARAVKARRLTQADAATLLGIDQSKVSRITRGQFRGVSEAKLLELVAKLGHDVKIVISPVRRRAGKIELQFA